MTPFGQTSVRTTTIPHHTERGTATTAHNARLRSHGADGFAHTVALSILAANLHRIGLLVRRRMREAERRRRRRAA